MKTGTDRAEPGKSDASRGGCGGDRGPTGVAAVAAAALVPGGFSPPRAGPGSCCPGVGAAARGPGAAPGLSAAAERGGASPAGCGLGGARCCLQVRRAPVLPAWIGV